MAQVCCQLLARSKIGIKHQNCIAIFCVYTEFNRTDQSGWKWEINISVLLHGKSQMSIITFCSVVHYQICATTNMTFEYYLVQVVYISVVKLAQVCCQFQSLMNLVVLKWHTPQHEIDTMIKIGVQTDQAWIGVDFSAGWILGSEWGTLMLMRCLHTKQSVVFMGTQKVVSSRK